MKQLSLTFPHVGDYSYGISIFFKRLGYRVVVPPKTSQSALSFGVSHAPNQACLPFKYTLGNVLETLESTPIDVVVIVGGKRGMCRLGYYNTLYEKIIADNGYDPEVFQLKLNKTLWQTVKRHFPDKTLFSFLKDFYSFWLGLRRIEDIRNAALKIRPRALNTHTIDTLDRKLKKRLAKLESIKELRAFEKEIKKEFALIPIDPEREVIKIGMVGELFLLIDQCSTLNLEKYLGELGVEVDSSLSFSHFLKGAIKPLKWIDRMFPTTTNKILSLAEPYINRPVGGHGMESTGRAALYATEGYQGVLHLYPLGCMPEVVAASVLPKVGADYSIPVLSLSFDEHTGSAGLKTRLEAFVDMIRMKEKGSLTA